MTFPALDRRSVIPLYYQIQQCLLGQIRSGTLKAGEPVLSEQEIATRLGVSRMTARQALKSLCDLGITYSQRGKGTFVSAAKLEKNIRQVLSFTEEMTARDLQPRSKVLSFETAPANGEIAAALQIAPGESVFKLRRIRLADSTPMGIECSYIAQHLCPDLLTTFDPSGSLYQALFERYRIQMAVADEVVEAALAKTEEARLLHIPKGSPVFLFTRTSCVQSGQPVEYVKSTYRGDRYKIAHRLTRLSRELLTLGK
ncbi:MAG: GntR family transcriptional regulator [Candidatus Sulfotelmatobacter sp.]